MNNKNTALLNYLLAWPKSAIVSEIWASFVCMAGEFLSHVPCFISVQSNFKFSNTLAAHLRHVLYMLVFFAQKYGKEYDKFWCVCNERLCIDFAYYIFRRLHKSTIEFTHRFCCIGFINSIVPFSWAGISPQELLFSTCTATKLAEEN